MTEIRLTDPLRANTDKGFAVKASCGLGLKGDCLLQAFKRSSFQVFKDTRMFRLRSTSLCLLPKLTDHILCQSTGTERA